jgi:hypothetical protein
MTDRERRQRGTSRIIGLHDDQHALDRELMARTTIEQRLEAMWDLVLEYRNWGGHGDQPRLQRSLCRVERSRR